MKTNFTSIPGTINVISGTSAVLDTTNAMADEANNIIDKIQKSSDSQLSVCGVVQKGADMLVATANTLLEPTNAALQAVESACGSSFSINLNNFTVPCSISKDKTYTIPSWINSALNGAKAVLNAIKAAIKWLQDMIRIISEFLLQVTAFILKITNCVQAIAAAVAATTATAVGVVNIGKSVAATNINAFGVTAGVSNTI